MTPEELLTRFEVLIAEERRAVVGLAAEQVLAFAIEKEELILALRQVWAEVDAPGRARFQAVVREMRNNCVLLAHARSCVRDAVESLAGPSASYGRAGMIQALPGRGARRRVYVAE